MTAVRAGPVTGAALAFACVSWPLRDLLEAAMATHMLVQFPALMLAGALLRAPRAQTDASGFGAAGEESHWNRLGIAGLVFAACVLAVAMIPRLLDLALVDTRVEAAKVVALLAAGAALRASWPRAGLVVQGFFLGNVLPMTAVVGMLYQDAPERLCNSYRLDEQVLVGTLLVALAIGAAIAWLLVAGVRMQRAENALRSGCVPDPRLARAGSRDPRIARGGGPREPSHEERSWPEDASTTTSPGP